MLSFTLMPSSAWTKFFKRCRFFTLFRSLLRFLFPFMCLGKSFGELFQSHCHRSMSYRRYGKQLFSNIIRNISTLTLSLSLLRTRNIVVNTRQTNSFNTQPLSRFHSQKTSSHARSTVSFQHTERIHFHCCCRRQSFRWLFSHAPPIVSRILFYLRLLLLPYWHCLITHSHWLCGSIDLVWSNGIIIRPIKSAH